MKSNLEERAVRLGEHIIEHKSTVRETAAVFGISKSTVHKDLTAVLPHLNRGLYKEVRAVLDLNKEERHLRGGQATKHKYESMRKRRER
ncbi:sporulation transcriptional regulator SpoIIID [uncultured Ruminococcus sp.]|uniref:sporulation transcriptional regulator SpoIIID n=1 Tax=uncultured Ruminococcus sp. TaxID=165186 RepID=UPI0029311679|nr:sporulation transcriptional regulator SpoIIID [uncultured Ruminococcus sp.]